MHQKREEKEEDVISNRKEDAAYHMLIFLSVKRFHHPPIKPGDFSIRHQDSTLVAYSPKSYVFLFSFLSKQAKGGTDYSVAIKD